MTFKHQPVKKKFNVSLSYRNNISKINYKTIPQYFSCFGLSMVSYIFLIWLHMVPVTSHLVNSWSYISKQLKNKNNLQILSGTSITLKKNHWIRNYCHGSHLVKLQLKQQWHFRQGRIFLIPLKKMCSTVVTY